MCVDQQHVCQQQEQSHSQVAGPQTLCVSACWIVLSALPDTLLPNPCLGVYVCSLSDLNNVTFLAPSNAAVDK